MFKTIKNAWSLPDLRKKILFTLLIIVVFRIGSVIQVPFLDTAALRSVMNPDDWSNTMLSYMNTLSGGAFSNATLFAMGITPYINSSIIIQLLCVAIPPLERLAREGEAGRRKISAITRYVTVGLGIIQGTAYYFYLLNSKVTLYNSGFELWFSAIVIILVFTAGTAVMMWLGEQINSHGIGNGISILLFAGIVAQFPQIINTLGQYWNLAVNGSTQFFFLVPLWVVLFVAVVWISHSCRTAKEESRFSMLSVLWAERCTAVSQATFLSRLLSAAFFQSSLQAQFFQFQVQSTSSSRFLQEKVSGVHSLQHSAPQAGCTWYFISCSL